MGRLANSPAILWSKVDVRGPDDCWNWLGYFTSSGYGAIQIAGRGYVAHRVAYALAHPGQVDLAAPLDKSSPKFVLHRCDNRGCCNQAHLFLGSYTDNNRDASVKGRARGGNHRGEKRWNAKLTAEEAREVRWIASKGIATTEIAPRYRVCSETVRKIVIGRAY